MSIARLFALAVVLAATPAWAQAPAPPAPGNTQQPGPQPPPPVTGAPTQAPGAPAPVVPGPTVPAAPLGARVFLGSTGIIFNAVRPDRVVDFELVIGFLQAAMVKSQNPQVREQAKGWRTFKAVEPGPNGTILYVFWIDPTVMGADYALGPILSEAFPDQVEQIWKLYQGALASGGSLLNLVTVQPPPLPPPGTPITPAAPEPVRPGPPPATTPPPTAAPPVSVAPGTTKPVGP